MGTPLDYQQNFTLSYQLPLNLIPVFDWIMSDAQYTANYTWVRGTKLDDGTSLGNTITNNRNLNINGTFNMEKLYNHIPFLKTANERFDRISAPVSMVSMKQQRIGSVATIKNKGDDKTKKALPKNKNSFETEITILPDTSMVVTHGKKSKRIVVTARTRDGHIYKLKYRKIDNNKIRIINKVDSALHLKITVAAKMPLENNKWYKTAQSIARVMMMVRNVSISYRNQYSMSLPGFMPNVGDALGQNRGNGLLSPGLDFAFGLTGDSYVEKSYERGWLLQNDSVATPATSNTTEDLQLRATLEPLKDLKIDLNATRISTKARSIQYMYSGMPTTQSGTFAMTTISIGSSFEGIGNANNGYHSNTFDKFCGLLDAFRSRVEAQYMSAVYPKNTSLAGKIFDIKNGTVNKYSADVMVPAFISAYTSMGGNSLELFPSLARLLPNWTLRYGGLVKLPWFRDVFKSFNINHSYKSIYTVGSYSSYSTFAEYMNGLGFITDTETGNPTPSSMFNVSTVSINEAFSPLLGIDMTFNNNITAKLEYRTVRSVNLSMTSVQVNEALSKDWVIGLGYKISDFSLFGMKSHRVVSSKKDNKGNTTNNRRGGLNHDLNLRLDMSYRNQAAITRDIASMMSNASSGNTAFKLSFAADYTLSRMLTMSFYYDHQSNTPLLSSSSYPTTTRDFGLSIKFSLTR